VQSTLSQIRTKGINRGGLYGFFVKGEAIAGTIDDTSSTTDTSIPPSGASTPPTSVSASDTEGPTKRTKMSDKKIKRQREEDAELAPGRKGKKDKKPKAASPADATLSATTKELASSNQITKDRDAVARKIAKLSAKEKAAAEERAAAKKQTLHEYIMRRIQKKSEKRSTRYDKSDFNLPFFTDLEGDPTLLQQAQQARTFAPIRPVLGLVEDERTMSTPRTRPTLKPKSMSTRNAQPPTPKVAYNAGDKFSGNAELIPGRRTRKSNKNWRNRQKYKARKTAARIRDASGI
jgi:nucleolar protein TMA23